MHGSDNTTKIRTETRRLSTLLTTTDNVADLFRHILKKCSTTLWYRAKVNLEFANLATYQFFDQHKEWLEIRRSMRDQIQKNVRVTDSQESQSN